MKRTLRMRPNTNDKSNYRTIILVACSIISLVYDYHVIPIAVLSLFAVIINTSLLAGSLSNDALILWLTSFALCAGILVTWVCLAVMPSSGGGVDHLNLLFLLEPSIKVVLAWVQFHFIEYNAKLTKYRQFQSRQNPQDSSGQSSV